MGGAPMMPGGGPDPAKVYKTEQDPAFHLPTCTVLLPVSDPKPFGRLAAKQENPRLWLPQASLWLCTVAVSGIQVEACRSKLLDSA